MKILVAGGTGFIGSRIVAELLALVPDASIRVLSRRAQTANPWGKRVEFVQANITRPPTLTAAVAGVDVAVQTVQFPGHPIENPAKGWTYIEVDGKGTRNLLQACKSVGTRRFVYFSGAGVGPGKKQPWFRAKWMAESAVRESGMEYVILRPSWVYGPADRTLNRFVALTHYLPFVPVIGDGKTKVQPVSVFDVAKIVALSVIKPEVVNQMYELGGPQELTLDEVLSVLQTVLGKRRPLIHLPIDFIKIVAGLLSMLPRPPLSPSAVDFILSWEKVDPRPAEHAFGIRFEDLETGLRRYLTAPSQS